MCNQATPNKHTAWSPATVLQLFTTDAALKLIADRFFPFDLKFNCKKKKKKKMSSEVLVSRPHYDSRAVAQGVSEKEPPVEIPQPSAGSATAGYRSAKYTPAEWFSNYHTILQQAGTDRHEARSIQRESKTVYQHTESATLKTQADGTRLLGERLQEIHHWRSELQRHIDQLLADTESLRALKTRLEKALDATETPYAIATDNLNCRARRPGPDLVRDTVEEELLKEVDLIRSVQALLKRTTAQVVSQIKMNREAKQTLESDWSDKYQAYNFDDHSGRCSNMSPDAQHHPSSAAMQDQVCNCTSWTKFTQDNLSKALQEEQTTSSLRVLVERVLQDTTEDLRVQCSSVDRAFSQRCVELIEAKTQLELKLAQTLEQIGAQERNIVALQQAIHNKEAPLRVVQSRLYLRSLRPNMELCRDEPQLSLEGEVRQIDATLASLHQQLNEARGSLSHLEESRITVEKDINCKTHSLFIERDKCMTHRKRYPAISTLSGY
ncbi:LOW QUALITY PROTEIN: tektin-4 [Enoplosus armatus]|uniref:LOW QUALITY PROTEIN: tektin-4 n=1 Tax=Enoplosus armatus TaxID=215367 RepID=UPI003991C503